MKINFVLEEKLFSIIMLLFVFVVFNVSFTLRYFIFIFSEKFLIILVFLIVCNDNLFLR